MWGKSRRFILEETPILYFLCAGGESLVDGVLKLAIWHLPVDQRASWLSKYKPFQTLFCGALVGRLSSLNIGDGRLLMRGTRRKVVGQLLALMDLVKLSEEYSMSAGCLRTPLTKRMCPGCS